MAVRAQAAQRATVAARSSSTRQQLKDVGEALVYLAPSLILFAAFVFIPLLRSFWLSLFYTNPIGNPTTVAASQPLVCPGAERPIGHGTPAEVAADLLRYREKAGVHAFQLNFHGNRDLGQLLEAMDCFMREVKPLVV